MEPMNAELRTTVVNMKTLSQKIPDPVVVIGAGDVQGRKLKIIFTQEAAARFTPTTKIYLAWYHKELDIRGYNIFTEITDPDDKKFPPTWEISYPSTMLHEGHVLACIQLVDSVSITSSTNFLIHVLVDPNADGSDFIASDDYTLFQEAVINLTNLENEVRTEFADMQSEFDDIKETAENAENTAQAAMNNFANYMTIEQADIDHSDIWAVLQIQEYGFV